MNAAVQFFHEHSGHLLGGTGVGFGASFVFLFQGMIRDTWNDWRSEQRQKKAAALAAATKPAPAPVLNTADRLGAEVTHALVEALNKDIEYQRTADERRWKIVADLAESVKTIVTRQETMKEEMVQQRTILTILANRS